MFGKTKDTHEIDEAPVGDILIDDFFGDEAAVAEAVRVDNLHQRLTGVEQQINSQFTSMAAYAQIAQEQVELVRSESQHSTERSEQRVVGLIERERSDRMNTGDGATTNVAARLDALDTQVAEIRETIQQCLSNQKALADAITDLFAQPAAVAVPTPQPPIAPSAPVIDEAASAFVPALEHTAPLLGTEEFIAHVDADTPAGAPAPVDAMSLLPAYDDTVADVTTIAPHDDLLDADEDFGVFAAPDIATIEPMTSLPAPVLTDDAFPFVDMPAPDHVDGPIAALSLD